MLRPEGKIRNSRSGRGRSRSEFMRPSVRCKLAEGLFVSVLPDDAELRAPAAVPREHCLYLLPLRRRR